MTDKEFDYEYEQAVETRGKIVKWGLIGVVGLVVAGGAILHSCSSRSPYESGVNKQMYFSPAPYSTNQ
jgi:hypothetical protein